MRGVRPGRDDGEHELAARIVAPPGAASEGLRQVLQGLRIRVTTDWPAPDPLPAAGDLVFALYAPDLANRIAWTPGSASLALIVLLPAGQGADARVLRLAGCDSVLPYPAPRELAAAAIAVVRDRLLYERRLRTRIEKLEETLRSSRTVERAKAVLMAERNMTEDEAYAFLRERATARRVTIGTVAAAVLDSHTILKSS